MTMEEARSFINKLQENDGNLTEDMREELRKLHDSADESIGMENYWKKFEGKIDDLGTRFDKFAKDYLNKELSKREYKKEKDEDKKEDKPEDIIERIFIREE